MGVGPVGQPRKVDDYRLAEESTDSIFTPVFCGENPLMSFNGQESNGRP